MLSGKFLHCFKLAGQWAPEAVQAAYEGLSTKDEALHKECLSCATEVAKKMGASDEEMIMVAGFAGGLGLSGAACGALGAAVWMKSLEWCREEAKKMSLTNPDSKETLDAFYRVTNNQILCSELTGRHFQNIDEHTEYLKNGGCASIIEALAVS